MDRNEILQKIKETKMIAVIRGDTTDEATSLAEAVLEAGLPLIELTYTIPSVQTVFAALKNNNKGYIGAGTVLDAETARDAILQGAKFVVSPHFNTEIAKMCHRYNILYIPGCMTITEMVKALEYGCTTIKLFPANTFQPSFIKAVKGPLPQIDLLPTGGINVDNVKDWLDLGAVGVGIGSDLMKAYRKGGQYAVETLVKNYLSIINVSE